MSHWRQSCVEELHFRAFFYGKTSPAKGESSSAAPVGGFGLQRRPRHDDVYPEYTPADTNNGWHGDWFYIRNPPEAPFPEFHGERPVRDLSWTWGTPTLEKTLAGEIKEIIRECVVKAWLNGVTLFYTMRERQVMPLAERRMPMWLYFGPSDPDRAVVDELPEDEVWSLLLMVLKGAEKDEIEGTRPPAFSSSPSRGPGGQGEIDCQQEAAREKRKKKDDRDAKRH
ncbi:hypothetical protein C2845_PM15G04270 [Panicum miliaceum]|uniref:Uncharacterized protein n=1 Tax=Panicum miliaceum TaxID=4540 RepID=A0A3L6Q8G0_PANMI|nr:hypothetical protein C2845_PM15G04270 [Panicum miliaceum]